MQHPRYFFMKSAHRQLESIILERASMAHEVCQCMVVSTPALRTLRLNRGEVLLRFYPRTERIFGAFFLIIWRKVANFASEIFGRDGT